MTVADIGYSWYDNYNSGSNTWISDSIVDTGYSLIRYGVGNAAFLTVGWIPGVGPVLGIAAAIAAPLFLDYFIGDEVFGWFKRFGK